MEINMFCKQICILESVDKAKLDENVMSGKYKNNSVTHL